MAASFSRPAIIDSMTRAIVYMLAQVYPLDSVEPEVAMLLTQLDNVT